MSKTQSILRAWQPGAPTVYIPIALPGSGKSTLVESHLKTVSTPTHVASTDDILMRMAAEMGVSYSEVHSTRYKEADRAFKQGIMDAAREGIDIIIDQTNLGAGSRRKKFAMIDSNSKVIYRRVAWVFDVPDEVLRERLTTREALTGKRVPWDVVEKMKAQYEAPSDSEFHIVRRVG